MLVWIIGGGGNVLIEMFKLEPGKTSAWKSG